MSDTGAIWIKDPLAILAGGAGAWRGGRRWRHRRTGRQGQRTENAGRADLRSTRPRRHSRPDQHASSFYQTLTRAVPAALDRELFPWLKALYPIWAKMTPDALDAAVTVAMAELMLSGCTTTTDHHYVFPKGLEDGIDIEIAAAKRLGLRRARDARLDEPVGARRRPASAQRGAGRGRDSGRQQAADRALSRARRGGDDAGGAGAVLRRFRSPHR